MSSGHECRICTTAGKKKSLSLSGTSSSKQRKERGINGAQHLGLKSVIRWGTGAISKQSGQGTSNGVRKVAPLLLHARFISFSSSTGSLIIFLERVKHQKKNCLTDVA